MGSVVSMRPSTFSQGGLIDDVDVTITKARWVRYDFEGKSDSGDKLCLLTVMQDADGQDHPQYFSAADLQFFVPSEDPKNEELNGVTIVAVGDKTALNGSSNCALFINSLVQQGFPEDQLDSGDARAFEGLKCHINRVPAPKRGGASFKQKEGATVLVVTKIIALPGESAPAKTGSGQKSTTAVSAAKSSSAQKPAAGSSPDPELVGELEGELVGLFASKGVSEMKKVDVVKGLFGTIDKSNGNKNKLLALAGKDEALKAMENFEFDGAVIKQK